MFSECGQWQPLWVPGQRACAKYFLLDIMIYGLVINNTDARARLGDILTMSFIGCATSNSVLTFPCLRMIIYAMGISRLVVDYSYYAYTWLTIVPGT